MELSLLLFISIRCKTDVEIPRTCKDDAYCAAADSDVDSDIISTKSDISRQLRARSIRIGLIVAIIYPIASRIHPPCPPVDDLSSTSPAVLCAFRPASYLDMSFRPQQKFLLLKVETRSPAWDCWTTTTARHHQPLHLSFPQRLVYPIVCTRGASRTFAIRWPVMYHLPMLLCLCTVSL